MAEYKYPQFLTQANKAAYDQVHHPATITPYSGIYRCTKCGHEVTSVSGYPLPPQNHHQHTAAQGEILWQLIVAHNWIR
ncbi:MAG TPA: hypothetical protein VFB28_09230 [Terriglobales bacterium]|nr:hypothetical protein [Terriglobales bacterium]